jgi:hypothetical protein
VCGEKEHHVTSESVSEIRGDPMRISEEGSKGISVDLVRDPWVIFGGDLGDIEGFLVRIL